jgi:2',3'-cyclic-nucleotide 2'-phosphodiesterase (5'-nucleotidase family)
MMSRPKAFAALLSLSLLGACSAPSPGGGEATHLRVLATDDFHGALLPRTYPWSDQREVGGAAALKAYMDRAAEECSCTTLRLDGGDVMQGTLQSNLVHGESSVAAFNLLGVDAAAIGNHELDWGVDVLRERLRDAQFAWLAANVFRRDTGERPDWARPWTVIERDGLKIGLIGYVTARTAVIVPQTVVAPYEFRPGYAGIADAVEAVHEAGAAFVAIVAHAGGECEADACSGEMVDLARELPEGAVDLIVGGHTHAPGQGVVNGVPIVRPGANAARLAVIDFYRQPNGGESFEVAIEPLYVDAVVPDAKMSALLEPWIAEAQQIADQPIVTLAEPLSNSPSGNRKLGDMITDAVRSTAEADLALTNPGGVRAPLPAGPISYDDVYRVRPFGNEVVKLRITGATLRQLIERTGNRYYYSNLSIGWNAEAAAGSRLVDLRFADGREVGDESSYTLATSDYLADAGDGLDMLAPLPREPMGLTVLDAMVSYLKTLDQPVRLPEEQRFRILTER